MSGYLWGVDWGTSSFRLALMDCQGQVLAQTVTDDGVARVPAAEQAAFLQRQIRTLSAAHAQCPVIMCGMVGSTLGWQEVPYVDCPVHPNSLARQLVAVEGATLAGPTWLVPGLRCQAEDTAGDVMRGEEVQLVGWLRAHDESALLCLPGTHAKWAQVQAASVRYFQTHITGELFSALSQHSVLVKGPQDIASEAAWRVFDEGVQSALAAGALASKLFRVRTRVLAGDMAAVHGQAFLSGLLIGDDIRQALACAGQYDCVHLVGSAALCERYRRALAAIDKPAEVHDGQALVLRGLFYLYQQRLDL